MRNLGWLKIIFILCCLFTTTLLLAGGGGGGGGGGGDEVIETKGILQNGNAVTCVGDTLRLIFTTDLPDPRILEWRVRKEGHSDYFYWIQQNGTDYTGTVLPIVTPVPQASYDYYRVTFESRGKKYYSTVANVLFLANKSKPGIISGNQAIVPNSFPEELGSSEDGFVEKQNVNYRWQKSVDQSSWVTIQGANNKTYAPDLQTVKTYYRRVVQNESNACRVISNTITVDLLKVSLSGEEGAFCARTFGKPLSVIIKGDRQPTIQWEKSFNDGAWTKIHGATGLGHTPYEINAGVYKYRAKASWNNGQSMDSDIKTIIYHPELKGGSVTPTHQIIVEGSTPEELSNNISPSGGTDTYIYQWERKIGASDWAIIPSATSLNYQPTVEGGVSPAGTYRRLVSSDGVFGCTALSNQAIIEVENLNPGTIGHNATIGKHGRHKSLVSTSPTNGIEFKWEIRSSDDDQTYTEWASVQDWSSNQNYIPASPLPGDVDTFVQYRRLARVGSTGEGVESTNYIKIKISSTDPGSILIDPSRVSLVQYDMLGLIMQDPEFPTTFGSEKRFKWQQETPTTTGFQEMVDWGSDTTEYEEYRYNAPFENVGIYSFRRLFVQDVQNKDDADYVFESNEVSVYVEALKGGKITIEDSMLMRGDIPSTLSNVESGNGKYYKWQSRNPQDTPDVWTDLTGWIENNYMEYTPTEAMTEPQRQYRRLCKTLESTADNLAESSNVITIYAQAVDPGAISIDRQLVVVGGRVGLTDAVSGDGNVFKWQVQRQNSDGTWGNWENLSTDAFLEGERGLGTEDINVRTASKYRRLSKLTIGEDNRWAAASNEVMVQTKQLEAGKIGRSQDIVKGGVPSKFISIEDANGNREEAYAWYRKKEGDPNFSLVGEFANASESREYQENEPVEVITYYRRIVKPLLSSDISDTIGSNTVTVTPSLELEPGSIAINPTGTVDTTVQPGFTPSPFHSVSDGTGKSFKWQKQFDDGTWIDVTPWSTSPEYHDVTPIQSKTVYRRCCKAVLPQMNDGDRLILYSNTITINIIIGNGGRIAGDTTLNKGDIPNIFRNVEAGDGTLYKWQKKVGISSWSDVNDWSSDNLDFEETSPIEITTYYRRLNKDDGAADSESYSSNIIIVSIEDLGIRDETVTAENFYLTLTEVSFGLTDEMLKQRANAKAIDNISNMPILITTVTHTIDTQVGNYQATFSTAKGESKTVKVYVTDNYPEIENGVLLFAHDFNIYTSEVINGIDDISNELLIARSEARAYDLNNNSRPLPITVIDRTELDAALATPVTETEIYPVIFGSAGIEIMVNVLIKPEVEVEVTFDVNFNDFDNQNTIENQMFAAGQPYNDLPIPTRSGSEFLYWSLDVEGLTPVDNTTIVGSLQGTEENHTLYAIWKYPVILDFNGGDEGEINTILVQQYRPYQAIQQLPVPTRNGYRFSYWSLDVDGNSRIDGTTFVEDANEHILYAIWEPREIIVTFDPMEGTIDPDKISKTVIFGAEYGELPIPQNGYYKFLGWYTIDGLKIEDTTIVNVVVPEIVLFARYQSYNQAGNDRYVITPNGDGLNDRFFLQFLWKDRENKIKEVNIFIYGRNGNMVYSKNNYQETDGDFDGGNLSDGTYIVAVHYLENEEKKVYNTTVTIIR